jgi:hypothetical protein
VLGADRPVLARTDGTRRLTITEHEVVDDVFASTLRDGASVLLWRLEPAAFDAVIALHGTLSERDRYFRFFTMHHPVHSLRDRLQ